ncbi:MAG: hypothetical protein CMJ85_10455 [Planctomycetes bacterium]|nr:hypothetical protein [Planctomycetota bacterium]
MVEVRGVAFGASGDEHGPIGGGAGYSARPTRRDHIAHTVDQLLAALQEAKTGEVVFVPGKVSLDFSARVYVDKTVLEISEGVTLASDRGTDGSPGALLFSDALATRPFIRTMGPNVRLSGLRLRGPDPERRLDHHRRSYREPGKGRDPKYYYSFPISNGIAATHDGLEVDNCELAGWSHAAIYLRRGSKHHIHHSFIHHNQYQGLGYGVCHDIAESLIERNLFDFNRHSIAGTGRPGSGYEARHNVERGTSLSHLFDMHGGRDRKDGTTIAGDWLHVHHNAFFCTKPVIKIRGIPVKQAVIERNWLIHPASRHAMKSDGRTTFGENAWGIEHPVVRTGR